MLRVSTYDRTSITFEVTSDGVNCTITNSRPEAAELWQRINLLSTVADNNDVVLTFVRGAIQIHATMPRDDIASIGYDLIQFLKLSRIGAEERGEPATAFEHPGDRWTHVNQKN